MTVEEKAQRYDLSLKAALTAYKDEDRHLKATLENTFPELQESEDDRKPNGGIVFEDFNEGDGFYKVNLAYLSKEQVEEIENIVKKWNPEPEESEDEKIRKAIHIYLDWLDGRKDYAPRGKYTIRDMIAWLEKQSTPQVRTGLEWLNSIDDACDKRYAEEYAHGEYCHEQSFKWGFQEGVDWLEKQSEPTDINPSEFDLRLNKLLKQFETLSKEELASSLSFYLNVVQNDGTYKADEKKGEQKPADRVEDEEYNGEDYGIDSLFHAKRILEKTLGSVEGYQTDDGILSHKCAISAVKKLYEQKSAWSEVDKDFMYDTLSNLTELKDRYGEGYGNVGKCIDWLKSLRPQKQWKPTKEQVEALHDLNLTGNISYAGQEQVLIELYKQLEKL